MMTEQKWLKVLSFDDETGLHLCFNHRGHPYKIREWVLAGVMELDPHKLVGKRVRYDQFIGEVQEWMDGSAIIGRVTGANLIEE